MRDDEAQAPRAIRAADWVFENLLAVVRRLLWPFWAMERATAAGGSLFWLLRNEYLKSRLGSCGAGVRLHGPITVTHPSGLKLGDNVHINRHALIRAEGGVSIGDNCHIARNLVIYSMNHDFAGQRLPYDHRAIHKPVAIGRNVWIGINVTIAPGSRIGDGAIVAMGAVVSGEVSAGSVVASPKASEIAKRDMAHYRRLDDAGCYGGMSGYPAVTKRTGKDQASERRGSAAG
jgi:acetyltransferase-like isoleucine patch superfamily enzyme